MFCGRPQVTSLLIVKRIPPYGARRAPLCPYETDRCDELSASGFHWRDALESGQEMQSGDRKREHEPNRILPLEQEGLGRPEIQAEQPDGQEQLAQPVAAVVGRDLPE